MTMVLWWNQTQQSLKDSRDNVKSNTLFIDDWTGGRAINPGKEYGRSNSHALWLMQL